MKRLFVLGLVASTILLAGCGIHENTKQTLSYLNDIPTTRNTEISEVVPVEPKSRSGNKILTYKVGDEIKK